MPAGKVLVLASRIGIQVLRLTIVCRKETAVGWRSPAFASVICCLFAGDSQPTVEVEIR